MLATQETPVYYPESDGQPMAETDTHRKLLIQMIELLGQAFPESYVSGNICLYYVPGDNRKMISPDVLLCRSQPPGDKRVYKAWETNNQLDLVIELSSKGTKHVDHHKKKKLYEQILQVPYYLIFDPETRFLELNVLTDTGYQEVKRNDKGYWEMVQLGIQLGIELPNSLCLFDLSGRRIFNKAEVERQAKEVAQEKAKQERQAKEVAQEKAKQEQQAKEVAQEKAKQEQQAKEAAEQELELLRAQLKALQGH